MIRHFSLLGLAAGIVLSGCSIAAEEDLAADSAAAAEVGSQEKASPLIAELACTPQRDPAGRQSPYDSVSVAAGDLLVKICYGRPSLRGRNMLGGEAVPYGRIWRTGANEPTIIHLATAAEIAGIAVEPGSYSLYTIPNEKEWTVIVNRSITQWGHESRYTDEVAAQEVGRAVVAREVLGEPVETFTITAEAADAGSARLLLEWETTRVAIPISARRS